MRSFLHRDLFSQGIVPPREQRRHRLTGFILPLTAAALGPCLSGCSGGTTGASVTTAGPIQTTSSNAPQPKIATVTNFGASITCGYYATQEAGSGYVYSQRGYAGRLDSHLGVPAQNLCRPGDQAADTVRTWVMPNTSPALGSGQLYTVLVGTNDVIACGVQAGCVPNWLNSLTAAITWMALPATDKVRGSSLSNLPSTWTPDLDFGVATTAPNASLSFPVTQAVDGRTLYIAYRVFDAKTITGGIATVQLDGKTVTTLSSIINSGQPIATRNGLHDTVFVAAIPLGAAGAHSVSITNGSAGGFFSFQWAGVSSGSYASVSGAPRVMASTLPPMQNQGRTEAEAVYNTALANLVSALDNEGMHVTLVHGDSAIDTTDLYDEIHPNDNGHGKIFAAFKAAL